MTIELNFKSVLRLRTDVRSEKQKDFYDIMRHFCGDADEEIFLVDDIQYFYDVSKRVNRFCPTIIHFENEDMKCYGLDIDYIIEYYSTNSLEVSSSINMVALDIMIKKTIDIFNENPFDINIINLEILTYTWEKGSHEPFSIVSEKRAINKDGNN